MLRRSRRGFAALLFVSLGCGLKSGTPPPDPAADAWLRMPPRELEAGLPPALTAGQFAPVSEAKRAAATEFLGDSPWRQISVEEAAGFSGVTLHAEPDEVVVLLRGVETAPQPDSYQVGGDWRIETRNEIVVVTHLCYRTFPWELRRRRPIVAALRALPKDVYVAAFVAY